MSGKGTRDMTPLQSQRPYRFYILAGLFLTVWMQQTSLGASVVMAGQEALPPVGVVGSPNVTPSDAIPPEDIFAGIFGPGESGTEPVYVVQPNDVLQVFVYEEPELSGRVLVRPDGRISVPLVQDLVAAGLTPAQLKRALEQRLTQYLAVPNVTVIVEEIRSYRVFVTGQVREPGGIFSEKPITVLQAISTAGGFQEFARENDIVVIRSDEHGHVNRFDFDYGKFLKGEDTVQNLVLESGDVVVVP